MGTKRKDPAAVSLGRKGGRKSAESRLPKLTQEQRQEIGRRLANSRWEKWRKEHPTKATETEVRRQKRAIRKTEVRDA
jgi:hypothetical protein